MLFGFGSISSARVALSLYALELGASAVGVLAGLLYVFPLLISWPVGRYADRVGSRRLLLLGAVCGAGAMLIPYFVRELPFFESVAVLAVVSFMFGLGMGCGQPITTLQIFSRSAAGRSGEMLGLRQSVNNAMRVSGPVVFGFIATAFGLPPVFWMSAIMMGGGGALSRPRRAG